MTLKKLWNSNCGGENEEWSPTFYAQYMRKHPERFANEGIREQLNMLPSTTLNESSGAQGQGQGGSGGQFNTYYGSVVLRCVPVLEFLNNRYVELASSQPCLEAESLLDNLNMLFKFHSNPVSYVYNSLMYYDAKFSSSSQQPDLAALNRAKKRRLFNILACWYR